MASIFKPKGKAKYIILYTDETGRRRKKTGATDKTVTQRIARDLDEAVGDDLELQIGDEDGGVAAAARRDVEIVFDLLQRDELLLAVAGLLKCG